MLPGDAPAQGCAAAAAARAAGQGWLRRRRSAPRPAGRDASGDRAGHARRRRTASRDDGPRAVAKAPAADQGSAAGCAAGKRTAGSAEAQRRAPIAARRRGCRRRCADAPAAPDASGRRSAAARGRRQRWSAASHPDRACGDCEERRMSSVAPFILRPVATSLLMLAIVLAGLVGLPLPAALGAAAGRLPDDPGRRRSIRARARRDGPDRHRAARAPVRPDGGSAAHESRPARPAPR